MVVPDPTPRTIPPRFQESLKVFLARGGELKDEYRFTLTTPVMGERVVRVKIGDRNAISTAQAQVAGAVARQLDEFLSSPENVQWLQQASDAQRTEAAVKAAREGLAGEIPGLPRSAEWFMTADILSSVGWPGLARKALDNAQVDPAAKVNAAAIQRLDQVILEQAVYRAPPEARGLRLGGGSHAGPRGHRPCECRYLVAPLGEDAGRSRVQGRGLGLQGDVLSMRGERVARARVRAGGAGQAHGGTAR